MRIRLLGSPVGTEEGRKVELRGAAGGLLCLLAVHMGSDVSTDRIAQFIWGDEQPRSSRTGIQVTVHRLRRILDPDQSAPRSSSMVVTTDGGYRLEVEPDEIDIFVFERRLAEAKQLAFEGSWAESIAVLQDALELWRGVPFGEYGDRPELMVEVHRLSELRLEAEDTLSEAMVQIGRASSARLRKLAEEEPLRERRWHHLMVTLYREGRHAESLQAFKAATDALEDSGLEPSPELYRLEKRILLHDQGLRAVVPMPARRSSGARLIGRETELATLKQAVASFRITSVIGPPGVGKTSLVRELLDHVGGRTFFIEVNESSGDITTALVAELECDVDTSTTPINRLAEVLGGQDTVLVLDGIDESIDGVRTLAVALVEECPRLHLIVTGSEALDLVLERVVRLAPLPTPSPLSDHETILASPAVRLFMQLAAVRGVDLSSDRESVAELTRELDGLPLALELAAALTDALAPSTILELISRGADPRGSELTAVFTSAFDRLSNEAKNVLMLAAEFQGSMTAAEVECVARHADDQSDVTSALIELARKSLLVRDDATYRLLAPLRTEVRAMTRDHAMTPKRHLAFREAVAEMVETADRYLKTSLPGPPMAILDRLRGDARKVVHDAFEAGEGSVAWRVFAAMTLYWWIRQARDEATEIRQLVMQMNRSALDDETELAGLACAAIADFSLAEIARNRPLLEEAAERARRTEASGWASLTLAHYATALVTSDRFHPDALSVADEAVAHAEASGEPFATMYALLTMGLVHAARLDFTNSTRYLNRSAAMAEASGLEALGAYAWMWQGHISTYAGEPARAVEAYESALAASKEIAWVHHSSLLGLAEAGELLGDLDTLDRYRSAAVTLRDMGDIRGAATAAFRAAALEIEIGHLERAERLLATAVPDLQRWGDAAVQAASVVTLATLDLALGDVSAATEHLTEAENLFIRVGVPPDPLTLRALDRLRSGLAGSQ